MRILFYIFFSIVVILGVITVISFAVVVSTPEHSKNEFELWFRNHSYLILFTGLLTYLFYKASKKFYNE